MPSVAVKRDIRDTVRQTFRERRRVKPSLQDMRRIMTIPVTSTRYHTDSLVSSVRVMNDHFYRDISGPTNQARELLPLKVPQSACAEQTMDGYAEKGSSLDGRCVSLGPGDSGSRGPFFPFPLLPSSLM